MANKRIAWLHGEIKTPPFSLKARIESGYLLRELQQGTLLSLPQSRPMPDIGPRCHELRVNDADKTWRIIYRIDEAEIIIAEVFAKKTNATPRKVISVCRRRLADYDDA